MDGSQASLSVTASIKFDQGVLVGVGHCGELIATNGPAYFSLINNKPSEKSSFSCSTESLIETPPERFQHPHHKG